ncbi:MAG: ComEC/Rec2 family competence protein, partial [Patescibacteria group bacterium]
MFRYALFAFLLGVALASFVSFSFFEFYVFFLCTLGIAVIGRKNVIARTAALMLIMMIAGAYRASADAQEQFFVPPSAPFLFHGTVVDEPVLRGAFQTARLDIGTGEQSRGVMRVRMPLIPEVRVGDSLDGTCNHILPVWESPGGVLFPPLCTRADAAVVSADHVSFARFFSDSRHFFQDVIDRGLPSPASDLLGGLLLGVDQTFSSELKEDFRRSGVSHIVAVSGYNIMIIMGMMWGVLRYAPLSRRRSFWLLVCAVILFTGLTGAQPATVRASIMGLMILLAQYLGRQSQSGHALLVAATAMVAWDPSLL